MQIVQSFYDNILPKIILGLTIFILLTGYIPLLLKLYLYTNDIPQLIIIGLIAIDFVLWIMWAIISVILGIKQKLRRR